MTGAAPEQAAALSRPLVLASGSPQRRNLLKDAGFAFDIDPADINEDDHPAGLLPGGLAQWLALQKARTVAARHPRAVVLGADTVVSAGGAILSKPHDADHARRMLRLLSGTTHACITGVAVLCMASGFERSTQVVSTVQMRPLTDDEVEAYIASDLWRGKAGAYGIQDRDPFVTRITGEVSNIVGLPLPETIALLKDAGVHPASARAERAD